MNNNRRLKPMEYSELRVDRRVIATQFAELEKCRGEGRTSFTFCTVTLIITFDSIFKTYIVKMLFNRSRLKIMKYLLFRMLFIKMWRHCIMIRRETREIKYMKVLI